MSSSPSLPASRSLSPALPTQSGVREHSLIAGHFSLPLALQERSYWVWQAPSLGFLCLWDIPLPHPDHLRPAGSLSPFTPLGVFIFLG